MKRIFGLSLMTLVFLTGLRAATTYNITSNTNWSTSMPSYCSDCIINVSPGITLTLNNSSQCYNCTFTGGTLKITAGFAFSSSSISNTTINASTSFNMWNSNSLNNVTLNMTSGNLAPGPITIDNSSFSFTGSTGFTINGASTISNSTFSFANSSSLTSNGAMTSSNSDFSFANSASMVSNGDLKVNNTNFTFSGSGSLTAGPISATGSNLTFNNTFSFTSNGQIDLDGSFLYLNNNSHLLANSPVNLKNGSKLVVGDGSKTSGAYLYSNSSVNLKDASSDVILSNTSNYFYSWSGFTTPAQTYSTVISNNPKFMGSAVFSSTGILPITVLPVTIGNFTGNENNQHNIKLSWTLTDASGKEAMQIERSNDGAHFITITSVALTGSDAGYTYIDESPEAGENNYRIKLIGVEGNISYSKIISVNISASAGGPRVFPNPCTGGRFQIRFPAVQSAMIRVFTTDGKLLYMNSVSGQSQYSLQAPGTETTRILVVQIITKEKTSSFNLVSSR